MGYIGSGCGHHGEADGCTGAQIGQELPWGSWGTPPGLTVREANMSAQRTASLL